ncbi:MAG: helix-hairpin-helix domain-containing protein [Acidimicrobiales bacterium]
MTDLPPPPTQPAAPSRRLADWATDRWASVAPVIRRRTVIIASLGGVLVVAAVAVVIAVRPGRALPEVSLPMASAPSPASAEPILAHAAGAVHRPGLYRLPAGSRVADLLEAAGGPVTDGDVDRLNLAARVNDGDRVYVPRVGELMSADEAEPGAPTGKLDLNAATQSQLEDLPGVGPATASAILDERRRRGRFKSVEDLLEVRGIGPAKYEQLRELVRV